MLQSEKLCRDCQGTSLYFQSHTDTQYTQGKKPTQLKNMIIVPQRMKILQGSNSSSLSASRQSNNTAEGHRLQQNESLTNDVDPLLQLPTQTGSKTFTIKINHATYLYYFMIHYC